VKGPMREANPFTIRPDEVKTRHFIASPNPGVEPSQG
jgi:hypothetical protein